MAARLRLKVVFWAARKKRKTSQRKLKESEDERVSQGGQTTVLHSNTFERPKRLMLDAFTQHLDAFHSLLKPNEFYISTLLTLKSKNRTSRHRTV